MNGSRGAVQGGLSIGTTAVVAGTLDLTTPAGKSAALGTVFTIIIAKSRTGTFGSVQGTTIGTSGRRYQIAYTATAVTLTVVAS